MSLEGVFYRQSKVDCNVGVKFVLCFTGGGLVLKEGREPPPLPDILDME
jgi:hypothetical protein